MEALKAASPRDTTRLPEASELQRTHRSAWGDERVRRRAQSASLKRCGGHGEPLVLLHPFALCTEVWKPILPALKRHHEVFALAIPGHHGSDPLPDDYRYS